MDQEYAKALVQSFAGALKVLQLYPAQHPSCERQIRHLADHLLPVLKQGNKPLRIGVMDGSLFLENHLFTDNPAADILISALQEAQLQGLEFILGLDIGEVRALLKLLPPRRVGGDFEDALVDEGVRHIRPLVEEESPKEVYGRAIQVIETIFRDARMGKVPSSREALQVVRSMVRVTLNAPHALLALTMLKDYDNYTFTHSVNVSVISVAVGRSCGLPPEQLQTLGLGALLHDLGKLKIDLGIINKPGRLTEEEFEEIMKHPTSGVELVEQMQEVPPEALDIILGHHLRYDRKGYPADARGCEISPLADMAAIADAYDAMTTLRSYNRPATPRKAIEALRKTSGVALHPEFVKNFIAFLGPYPVGSLVRLESGEAALVVWIDVNSADHLRLKILFDAEGRRLADPPLVELRGADTHRIVAEIEPDTKGIIITDFLDDAAGAPGKG